MMMMINTSKSRLAIVFLSCLLAFLQISAAAPFRPFRIGFYRRSCPAAEAIVGKHVNKVVRRNPGIGAGIIRIHFHDCFVRGCDGSVLLDGPESEKQSITNRNLRGLEVIDAAKAELERLCPGIVSCADIIAFAARDSAWTLGQIYYDVPSGRRDGFVSLQAEPGQNLPSPFVNASALRDSFARKGLSLDEMVTLSGAHSIGIAHCNTFSTRLFPTVDPTLDPRFASSLIRICPRPVNGTPPAVNPSVNLDILTPDRLDNKYYEALKRNVGVLISDQTLMTSRLTVRAVLFNAQFGDIWARKYAAASVKMGKIGVLTGTDGEIRKNCRVINR